MGSLFWLRAKKTSETTVCKSCKFSDHQWCSNSIKGWWYCVCEYNFGQIWCSLKFTRRSLMVNAVEHKKITNFRKVLENLSTNWIKYRFCNFSSLNMDLLWNFCQQDLTNVDLRVTFRFIFIFRKVVSFVCIEMCCIGRCFQFVSEIAIYNGMLTHNFVGIFNYKFQRMLQSQKWIARSFCEMHLLVSQIMNKILYRFVWY